MDIHFAPVIEAGSFQLFVVGRKTEFAYQVQNCTCCTAKTGDIPGVRRDLRLYEHYMKGLCKRHLTPVGVAIFGLEGYYAIFSKGRQGEHT
jgi:hypothetical protein